MAKPYAQSTVTEAEIEMILTLHGPVVTKVLGDGRQIYGCQFCSRNDREEWPCLPFRVANYLLEMRGYAVRLEKQNVRQHARIASLRTQIDAFKDYLGGSPFERLKDILRHAFACDDACGTGSRLYALRPILAEIVGLPPRSDNKPEPPPEKVGVALQDVRDHAVRLIGEQMAAKKAGNLPPQFVRATLPPQEDPPTLYATLTAPSPQAVAEPGASRDKEKVEGLLRGDGARFAVGMQGGTIMEVSVVPGALGGATPAPDAKPARFFDTVNRRWVGPEPEAKPTHDEHGFALCPRCGQQKDEEDASLCTDCSSADIAASVS